MLKTAYTEQQLQTIYDSIAVPTPHPVRRSTRPFDGARRKFLKVYRSPGYPVDPRLEASRALDAYVNVFVAAPPANTFDYDSLRRWVLENGN